MGDRKYRAAEVAVAFLIAGTLSAPLGYGLLPLALLLLGAWRLTDFVVGELLRLTPFTNRSKNDG